jgi:hypothetical protein
MKMRYMISIALLSVVSTHGTVGAESSVPVTPGGDAVLDACASLGKVRGLRRDGDNFLAVRSGPGTRYTKIDKLVNGDEIYVCNERLPWLGVVYSGLGEDCGVTTPWPEAGPYDGPCKSGWVHRNWVEIIAG